MSSRILRSLHSLLLCTLLAACFSSPALAALSLTAEINPDPAEPGEMIDVQISVSSTSASGNLTLRMPWPAGLNSSPWITGGATCNGSCSVGEVLSWDLGSLGPGQTATVAFNETVGSVADGTLIQFAFELLDGGSLTTTLDIDVEVQADSPLELVVDPASDPAATGSTLVYELVYGNESAATSTGTMLTFPIPDGTQFLAATGGGVLAGNTVSWNLGSLPPDSGGRQRVSVQVNAATAGTLLVVDAAEITGQVNFLARSSLARASSRVGSTSLDLAAEWNPDPVDADEMVDTQISVSNTGAGLSGNLTLRMWWPGQELNSSPWITGGATCNGSCSAGEYLVWNLGSLGPGARTTVAFNEFTRSSLSSGVPIPFEIELFEGGLPARTVSRSLLIQSDSPLEIVVDPLDDPALPGALLVYEVIYGNNGSASSSNTVLSFPVPAGTTFSSASSGGVFASGEVTWNLGTLPPNSGGRQRVAVVVDAAPTGAPLVVDAAEISGVVNFQARSSLARALSHVGGGVLELGAEVNPDPVDANQMLDMQISVGNTGGSPTGTLSLRMWWPGQELNSSPWLTDGATCNGSCSPGEYLVWTLGSLGPGVTRTVAFNEFSISSLASGTLIPFEIELLEAGRPVRTASHTLLVQTDSPLELRVDPVLDPAPPNGSLAFDVTFGNSGPASANNAELTFPVPAGTRFQSATGGGRFTGDGVTWDLGTLTPGAAGRFRVTTRVENLDTGSLLEVDAATLGAEVNFQERTSRARAVGKVALETLGLSADIAPDPVQPGDVVTSQLRVENPGGNVSGNVSVRLWWPGELNSSPFITGGATCNGSCSTGEYLVWDLGALGPGVQVDVSVSEDVRSVTDGTLIPFEIELFEGGLPVKTASRSLVIHPFADHDNDGEADVLDPDDDNDGMPDWWELENGLDAMNAADAGSDPDMDGFTNLEEFLAGSDPNEPNLFVDGFESGNTDAWSSSS